MEPADLLAQHVHTLATHSSELKWSIALDASSCVACKCLHTAPVPQYQEFLSTLKTQAPEEDEDEEGAEEEDR